MGTDLIGATQNRHTGRGRDDRRSLGEMVLSGRNRGQKMFSIALDLGISEESAYRYMKLALDARIAPTVDEFRRQQNDSLDESTARLQQQLDALDAMLTTQDEFSNGPSVNMAMSILAERRQTVTAMGKLDERRAKLNGLDAPVRADVTVTVQDSEDAELSEMLAEARAAQARKVES